MEKKKCCKCTKEKIVSEFNTRGKYYQPWCRECQNKNAKLHYQNNKKSYRDKNDRLRKLCIDYVVELKKKSKCKCGENHFSTLQFHHRNPKEKLFNIANITGGGYSLQKVKNEIAKCEILCANCHCKLHYKTSET